MGRGGGGAAGGEEGREAYRGGEDFSDEDGLKLRRRPRQSYPNHCEDRRKFHKTLSSRVAKAFSLFYPQFDWLGLHHQTMPCGAWWLVGTVRPIPESPQNLREFLRPRVPLRTCALREVKRRQNSISAMPRGRRKEIFDRVQFAKLRRNGGMVGADASFGSSAGCQSN